MAIIYTYPTKTTLALGDLALISDSADGSKTKNATMSSIKDVIDVVDTFTSSFGTYVSGTTNAASKGAVSIGTVDLSAVDGTAVSGTRFLSKDNTWDVPVESVTSVTSFNSASGKGGIVTTPTTGDVKVGIDILPLTDLSTGAAGEDLLFVVDDPSGDPINKKLTIDRLFGTAGLVTNSSINYNVKLPNTVGTANQVLKLPSTIGATPHQLTWADDTTGVTTLNTLSGAVSINAGTGIGIGIAANVISIANTGSGSGTVTSITSGADSGTATAITTSGTLTFTGGTNVTTSVSGTTVTINSSDQYAGTVTGTGTAKKVAKWSTGGTGIEDSLITDDGTDVKVDKLTILKGDGTSVAGKLQLNCHANSHYVELMGPVHASGVSYSLQFPNTIGTANQVLKLPASPGANNLLVWDDTTNYQGFSPFPIYQAKDSVPVGAKTIIRQSVCETAGTYSKLEYFAVAASLYPVYFAIYTGTIIAGGNKRLEGFKSTQTAGINVITFSSPYTLVAGQDIVIVVSGNDTVDLAGSNSLLSNVNISRGSEDYTSSFPASLTTLLDGITSSVATGVCTHIF